MFPYRDSQPHDDEPDGDAPGVGAPGGTYPGSAVTGITPGRTNPAGDHPGGVNLGASVLSSGAEEDSGTGRRGFGVSDGASARTHPAVLGVTVAGFLCLLAAFALPWLTTVGGAGGVDLPGAEARDGLYLSEIPGSQWAPLGWSVLLALVVMTIVGGARLRRPLAGAAVGWAAGQLGILVGLAGDVSRAGGLYSPFSQRGVETSAGVGLYVGFAGVVLLGVAALLLLRPRRPGRVREPEPESDDGPLDLTVTSLPPPAWGREGTG